MKTFLCEENVLRHYKRNCSPSYPDHYLNIDRSEHLLILQSILVSRESIYKEIPRFEVRAKHCHKKNKIAFLPTKHLGVHMNSFKRVRVFQI